MMLASKVLVKILTPLFFRQWFCAERVFLSDISVRSDSFLLCILSFTLYRFLLIIFSIFNSLSDHTTAGKNRVCMRGIFLETDLAGVIYIYILYIIYLEIICSDNHDFTIFVKFRGVFNLSVS